MFVSISRCRFGSRAQATFHSRSPSSDIPSHSHAPSTPSTRIAQASAMPEDEYKVAVDEKHGAGTEEEVRTKTEGLTCMAGGDSTKHIITKEIITCHGLGPEATPCQSQAINTCNNCGAKLCQDHWSEHESIDMVELAEGASKVALSGKKKKTDEQQKKKMMKVPRKTKKKTPNKSWK